MSARRLTCDVMCITSMYELILIANFQIQDALGVYGVVLVSPSVTPFGHINPSFRIFTMDASSMQLLDYTQYHLNLTRANGNYSGTSE